MLRIEDTDVARTVPGTDKYILDALDWMGISPDEGWDYRSPLSYRYRQTVRAKEGIYAKYVEKLLASGNAYFAFDTPEEIDAMRLKFASNDQDHSSYNHLTRMNMRNSLTLSPDQVAGLLANDVPYVIRFKYDNSPLTIHVDDLIHGTTEFATKDQDDKVLIKADGIPTYHLANVVDDIEMGITHVIRGQEWLPSTPLHISLYKALGVTDAIPKFAHLPLVLRPDNGKKISKRDTDNMDFPVFPFSFYDDNTKVDVKGLKELGYLPQAVVNVLALTGWNPGNGSAQEIFSMDELISQFTLENVNKASARYDVKKLNKFNRHYIKITDDQVLADMLIDRNATVRMHHRDYVKKVVSFMKDRVNSLQEIYMKGRFFFVDPVDYDLDFIKGNYVYYYQFMIAISNGFATINRDNLTPVSVELDINMYADALHVDRTKAIQLLNIIMTGSVSAPNIANVISILGKNMVMDRFTNAIDCFSKLELKTN